VIKSSVNSDAFDSLKKEMRLVRDEISGSGLNLYRAKRLRKFIINKVEGGMGLKPISRATKIIHRKNHLPEWHEGRLVEKMRTRSNPDKSASVGFFEDSEAVPGKKITVTQAMILQHTGYRIPLTGDKGEKVRKWLAFKGVFDEALPKSIRQQIKSGGWIIVPPRPFMFTALLAYDEAGSDIEATKEYLSGEVKDV